MASNGYGTGPVPGHIGRIPNYGKPHMNAAGVIEPPACIQNAMMTKDKKPFTYTPGGLDLSQIRTPSMARRLAKQKSWEDHEQAYAQQPQRNGGNYASNVGGPVPPPPPPPQNIPAPPPPPPLVIKVTDSKSPKPIITGERPEIVIPENPIGMLRKTNSPYHWEAEKAQFDQSASIPKFQDKNNSSPLTVKMPPSSFYQQPPQNYSPQNNYNQRQNQTPESPVYKPEAQYPQQTSNSPNVSSSPLIRDMLQRQDSQYNKSPQPFNNQSPISNGSSFSPSPNNNWRQPDTRDSPSRYSSIPMSPQINRGPLSPAQQNSPRYQNQTPTVNANQNYNTIPPAAHTNVEKNNNNTTFSNSPQSPKLDNSAPWRSNTLNRSHQTDNHNNVAQQNLSQQQNKNYSPPWASNGNSNVQQNNYTPQKKQESNVNEQQSYQPPWVRSNDNNNNNINQENFNAPRMQQDNNRSAPMSPPTNLNHNEQQRYQSSLSIPITPKKSQQPNLNTPPQKEAVYVNQEPVYFCPESPKSMPPWVKTQKEKTKTPPPVWTQRPLDSRRSIQRELETPPREGNQEPEWVKKSNEMQRGNREVISPPKYQQHAQPVWSTRPSENRKSLPKDNPPGNNQDTNRIIPIQLEVTNNHGRHGNNPPHLRISIDMDPRSQAQPPTSFSQPTQRIMRVLSPQLVRFDGDPLNTDLPTLSRHHQNNMDNQPRTRIIPIKIESDAGPNKSIYYHKFNQEAPPRQSKSFRVLQVITGTENNDEIQ